MDQEPKREPKEARKMTPDEIRGSKIHDAKLLTKVFINDEEADVNENGVLMPTEKQVEEMRKEMENNLEQLAKTMNSPSSPACTLV